MSYHSRTYAATVVLFVLGASAVLTACGVTTSAVQYPPFIKAAQRGDVAEADRLMRSGEPVMQTTIGDQTALHVAAIEGQNEMVVWLLAHEADPEAKDANGKTPADFARQGGHPDTERIILDQIKLYSDEDAVGKAGNTARFRRLLARDSRKLTLLHAYARAGMTRAVEKELALGGDPNAKTEVGYTPLHSAIDGGDIEVLRRLLDAGADPDARDVYDETPLAWTAINGRPAMAKILLQAGADPGIRTVWGETPAQLASRLGHANVAAVIDKGL